MEARDDRWSAEPPFVTGVDPLWTDPVEGADDVTLEVLLDAFAQLARAETQDLDDWAALVVQGIALQSRLRVHLARNQFRTADVIQRALFQGHTILEGLQVLLAQAEEFADEYETRIQAREHRIVVALTAKDPAIVRAFCWERDPQTEAPGTAGDFLRRWIKPTYQDGESLPKETQDVAKRLAAMQTEAEARGLAHMRRQAKTLESAIRRTEQVHYSVKSLADPRHPRDLWHGA